jgi:hypothetical protein
LSPFHLLTARLSRSKPSPSRFEDFQILRPYSPTLLIEVPKPSAPHQSFFLDNLHSVPFGQTSSLSAFENKSQCCTQFCNTYRLR